ncbi:Reticulon-4-interacting protein 1 homolog, mitochondrial [Eumeta japonica]|uniref:Reticulon-4-interacting protein 1 homolog, mitochondrial n=1 Tax=Eumeta variegata TaxID=151549 RepID=A0A4C1TPD3_EUMVA|nr:Reticulon-4-interacting protein 1 homolog, mitochondrial [Eumeta japonica]
MLERLLRRFKPGLQYCRYLVTQSQIDVANRAKVTARDKMYAWQIHSYGELSELRLDEARVPSLRGPDEILVRVHASSINPLDIAMIGGYGSRIFNTLRTLEGVGAKEGVEFPLVLGRDFCGVVERAGPDAVNRLSPGTLVWGVVPPHWPGAHAEYVVVKERWAGPAPRALSELEAGGALYAALTARAGLLVAGLGVRKNEARRARVLLLGVGGVGSAALQLLVHSGAELLNDLLISKGDVEALKLKREQLAVNRSHSRKYSSNCKIDPRERKNYICRACAGSGYWNSSDTNYYSRLPFSM